MLNYTYGLLTDVIKNIEELDINLTLFVLFQDQEIQQYVIFLNTEKQLFQKGEDANMIDLETIGGSYSELTQFLKARKGLPIDRVTLFDTGEFYDSFEVEVLKDALIIDANTRKDEDDLTDRWGKDIIGLSAESIENLIEVIQDDFVTLLIEDILKNR